MQKKRDLLSPHAQASNFSEIGFLEWKQTTLQTTCTLESLQSCSIFSIVWGFWFSWFLFFFLVVVFVFFPTLLSVYQYLFLGVLIPNISVKKPVSLKNQHRMDLPSYFLYKTSCFYTNWFNFCLKKPMTWALFIQVSNTVK